MADKVLEMELSSEDENTLREHLTSWKEEAYSAMLEEVEEAKEKKIEEIEEANVQYREELKEEFANKMITSLEEMRESIRNEVFTEMVENNPELHILEEIKKIIAPTLNEDYLDNAYNEEIQSIIEENNSLKERIKLEEGAKKLAELIEPYSEKTQNILLAMIKEGGPEEVTEQFYALIESLESLEEEDEEDELDNEEEFEEEDELDDEDYEEEDEEEDEEFNEEDELDDETYIEEEEIGEEVEKQKRVNPLLSEIKNLI